MSELYSLVITVDRYGEKSKVLMTGSLHEIDKFTTTCENTGDLRENFHDEIKQFNEQYGKYMQELTKKNNKKERGDITILSFDRKKRIRVLYKKHLFVFKHVMLDKDFTNYLIENYPELCSTIVLIKKRINHILSEIVLNEGTSIVIRIIYKIYKEEYAKQYHKPTPDKLYQLIDIPEPPDSREEDPEYEELKEDFEYEGSEHGPRLVIKKEY